MMSTITGCLQEGVIERMKYTLDYQKYAELARRVAAEGSVLLRNEEDTLPLRRGQSLSITRAAQAPAAWLMLLMSRISLTA